MPRAFEAATRNLRIAAVAAAIVAAFSCGRRGEPARDLPVVIADDAAATPSPDAPGAATNATEDATDAEADAQEPVAFWPIPSLNAIGRTLAEFRAGLPPDLACEERPRPAETGIRCRTEFAGQAADAAVESGTTGRVTSFEIHLVTDPSPITGEGRRLSTEEVLAWASAVEAEATRALGPPLPPEPPEIAPAGTAGGDVSRRSVQWRSGDGETGASLHVVVSPDLRVVVFRMARAGSIGSHGGAR